MAFKVMTMYFIWISNCVFILHWWSIHIIRNGVENHFFYCFENHFCVAIGNLAHFLSRTFSTFKTRNRDKITIFKILIKHLNHAKLEDSHRVHQFIYSIFWSDKQLLSINHFIILGLDKSPFIVFVQVSRFMVSLYAN